MADKIPDLIDRAWQICLRREQMETRERYETTETAPNGTGASPDASSPAPVVRERVRADRVVVQLVLAREHDAGAGWVKVGEINYLDAQQRPVALFADASDGTFGTALEKFIQQAIEQAEQQG